MIGSHGDPVGPRQVLHPRSAGGSINGMRVLMGVVLALIAVASITGVVVTLENGQPTTAFAIGLIATAFFARVGC